MSKARQRSREQRGRESEEQAVDTLLRKHAAYKAVPLENPKQLSALQRVDLLDTQVGGVCALEEEEGKAG